MYVSLPFITSHHQVEFNDWGVQYYPPHIMSDVSVVEWLGRRTHDSRVKGSSPGHDTAWLFISETGDRLSLGVNCLGDCNHHLGQLSLVSLGGR